MLIAVGNEVSVPRLPHHLRISILGESPPWNILLKCINKGTFKIPLDIAVHSLYLYVSFSLIRNDIVMMIDSKTKYYTEKRTRTINV